MEYQAKEKGPYYGVWQTCLLLIVIPIALYFILYNLIGKFQEFNELAKYTAMGFGFGIGSLFHISCAIAGLFKGTFKVVKNRIGDLFSNLKVSAKFAFKYYWEDVKSEGIVFWIYFVIILTFIILTITSFTSFFKLYNMA